MYLSDRGASPFNYSLPDRPITISVEAPGYTPWHFVDPKTGNNYLKLSGSATLSLTVPLVRIATQ